MQRKEPMKIAQLENSQNTAWKERSYAVEKKDEENSTRSENTKSNEIAGAEKQMLRKQYMELRGLSFLPPPPAAIIFRPPIISTK